MISSGHVQTTNHGGGMRWDKRNFVGDSVRSRKRARFASAWSIETGVALYRGGERDSTSLAADLRLSQLHVLRKTRARLPEMLLARVALLSFVGTSIL